MILMKTSNESLTIKAALKSCKLQYEKSGWSAIRKIKRRAEVKAVKEAVWVVDCNMERESASWEPGWASLKT